MTTPDDLGGATLLQEASDAGRAPMLRLLLCSLFGVGLFLMPVPYGDSWTIVLGIMSQEIRDLIGDNLRWFTVPIFIVGALIAALYNLTPGRFARSLPKADVFVSSHWLWTALALIGGVVSTLTLFELGPAWMIGQNTGLTAYVDVAGAIFLLVGLGCLFLPFLTDYGLLEFVGVLLQRPFQRVFGLPGRATVDTLASWVGSSSIAVIMTGRQFEKGFYTAREASVIATNFSVVSIPFVFFTVQIAGIPEHFFALYGSMIGVCLICALATPRLPPLRGVAEVYYGDVGKQLSEDVPAGKTRGAWALERALGVAAAAPGPAVSLRRGLVATAELFLTMMPAAMTIEFIALATYEHTSILQWITWPLISVLELLQIPEAVTVAPGLLVGLFDQFVPAIIAGSVEAPIAKFVLAGLSVTQLIFFAESAILITRSAIPLSVPQLVAIFVIRTIIALPLLALIAHLLF
ncbi:MAG: YjiH family protein [Congregibacter sp.]